MAANNGGTYYQRVNAFKASVIEEALRDSEGVRTIAAERLGLTREYLSRLVKELAIAPPPPPRGFYGVQHARQVRARLKALERV